MNSQNYQKTHAEFPLNIGLPQTILLGFAATEASRVASFVFVDSLPGSTR
jgi:hypothetical protein